MVAFNFLDESLKSTDGKVTAQVTDCTYYMDYEGETGVFCIERGGYIAIEEEALAYNAISYAIKLRFWIDEGAKGHLFLLKGTTLPIWVYLEAGDDTTYRLCTEMIVQGKKRKSTSVITLQKAAWHVFELVLLDGVYYYTINGVLGGRRVFEQTPVAFEVDEQALCFIGFNKSGEVDDTVNPFVGYISEVAYTDRLEREQEALAKQLSAEGYMEIESKYDDLASEGIELGAPTTDDKEVLSDRNMIYQTYRAGVITWTPAYRSVYMSQATFDTYLGLGVKDAGLPVEDEQYDIQSGIKYCLCSGGVLFQRQGIETILFMRQIFAEEYLRDGWFESVYGLPVGEKTLEVDDVVISCFECTKRTLFYIGEDISEQCIFSVNNLLMEQYEEGYVRYGLIKGGQITGCTQRDVLDDRVETVSYFYLPCTAYTLCMKEATTRWNSGVEQYQVVFITAMPETIYSYFVKKDGINKEKNYGEYKYPLGTVKETRSGTVYQAFHKGVIMKPKYKAVTGLINWRATLINIEADTIDDGIGDHTPELYIVVDIVRNGEVIIKQQRWPNYSVARHGHNRFDIIYQGSRVKAECPEGTSVYYDIPNIRPDDVIKLNVGVYDYDSVSRNDFLGRYTFYFDIETGWGLVEDYLKSTPPNLLRQGFEGSDNSTQASYIKAYLMREGDDNEGGRDNIQFSFRLNGEQEPYELDSYFRKYGFWSMRNFSFGKQISEACFNRVYHAQTGEWYDHVIHLIDCEWYKLVSRYFSPEEGHCFGLALEALTAINRKSIYSLPLYHVQRNASTKADLDKGFCSVIEEKHIYQAGWEHMKMVAMKILKGQCWNPVYSFEDIRRILDRDKYCLVNLCESDTGGYHTVLGYKYEADRDGQIKIFVADSNMPWTVTDPDDKGEYKDCSFITIEEDDDGTYIQLQNHKETKRYGYGYGTPYSILEKNPSVPSLWGIISFAATVLFVGFTNPVDAVRAIDAVVGFATGSGEVIRAESDIPAEHKGITPREKSITSTSLRSIDIPCASQGAIQSGDVVRKKRSPKLRMMVGRVDNALKLKVRGTEEGTCTQVIVAENQVITVAWQTSPDEIEELTISGLKNLTPEITMTSGKPVTVSVQSPITKYGQNARSCFKQTSNKALKKYFLNKRAQTNGEHEMHVEGCKWTPKADPIYLGAFETEEEALVVAKYFYPSANGCCHCCSKTDTDKRH